MHPDIAFELRKKIDAIVQAKAEGPVAAERTGGHGHAD
jgi:hypothetical protein